MSLGRWALPLCALALTQAACSEPPCLCGDACPAEDGDPDDAEVDADRDLEEQADADWDADVDDDADADADVDAEVDAETDGDGEVEAEAEVEVEVEVECSTPAECDDLDPCTFDRCEAGACRNEVPSMAVLRLEDSGTDWADLSVDLGGPGLAPEQLRCESTRNEIPLFVRSFDDGLITPFEVVGNVLAEVDADSQDPPTGYGASLCDDLATLSAGPFDLTGEPATRAALLFSMNHADLGESEYLEAAYSLDGGSSWPILAMVGDDASPPGWHRFRSILPAEAQASATVQIRFSRHGGSESACAFLDEVALVELPPTFAQEELLRASFEGTTFSPLVGEVSEPDDFGVDTSGHRAWIGDNNGAYLWTELDVSSVGPNDQLRLSWLWTDFSDRMDRGDYLEVQVSLDRGASWSPLSTLGQGQAQDSPIDYAVLLPPEARGALPLRFRFLAPETSTSAQVEGAYLDDVVVTVDHLELIDSIGTFEDEGDGTYRATLTTPATETGEREVTCFWRCGDARLATNRTSLSLP